VEPVNDRVGDLAQSTLFWAPATAGVSEDAVFEAVRALAADGEYLDDIRGIPVAETGATVSRRC